ncbi:carbamoyltransferase [Mucilaginibacter gracilis]|uniref:Carbamoyltransferase n=1 Tax=Mucilaginibacter gracilis TaxID=423350 RepID=A0A495JAA9_9SPHI|nr:carbamoyltransferase [Mucilaginibacter gracilis]RKR85753.1 carbamoyltransferase [Mucilaginibacter gracilis]
MYTLGISAYFHDSAACLLKDDYIVAAVQEERFTRKKNDESFPLNSILYCLSEAKITLNQVAYIVFYEKPFLKFERLLDTYLTFAPVGFVSFVKAMPVWLKDKLFLKKSLIKQFKSIDGNWNPKTNKLLFTTHHQSHAASAFYPSPFNKAIVLTADGVGEWTTTSVAIGIGNRIEPIKEINFPHSIGLLYSAFTYYLGFKVNCDEYKVMGLAPYGEPLYTDLIFRYLVDLKDDGSFRLCMQYFNYCSGLTMTSSRFNQLFGQPPRQAGAEISQFYMDMASSIQAATEKIMLMLTSALHREYQIDDLCMAGGVALNCVVNGKILKQSGFKRIWIQPAAGDAGGALGAAYAVYYGYSADARKDTGRGDKMQNALLGPSFSNDEIREFLIENGFSFEELSTEKLNEKVAACLADGKVVGYFRGRMEFGPRALGARSILADPRNAAMQSVLNQKIKFRESFRPFAPAVLEEHAAKYFEWPGSSPYMLFVTTVKQRFWLSSNGEEHTLKGFDKIKIHRSVIPAVTHIDYTSRLQTVNSHGNTGFYNLLQAFYKLTGCPCLINTSFNRMDEPIVNTPRQAIACFMQTGMDILVLEDFLLRK